MNGIGMMNGNALVRYGLSERGRMIGISRNIFYCKKRETILSTRIRPITIKIQKKREKGNEGKRDKHGKKKSERKKENTGIG